MVNIINIDNINNDDNNNGISNNSIVMIASMICLQVLRSTKVMSPARGLAFVATQNTDYTVLYCTIAYYTTLYYTTLYYTILYNIY